LGRNALNVIRDRVVPMSKANFATERIHEEGDVHASATKETGMQKITLCLWFDDNAEDAAKFYVSVFPNSKINRVERYGESGSEVSGMKKGSVMTVTFSLNGNDFMALNGGPIFKFSEAISFMIECEDQEEMDYYYDKISAEPKAEQCGWLKDKYGLSWQLIPKGFDKLMENTDPKKKERMMAALLKMKRIDLKKLEAASEGQ